MSMVYWMQPLLRLPVSLSASVALHVLFLLFYTLLSLGSKVPPPVTPNIRVHLVPEIAERTTVSQSAPSEAPVVATTSKQTAPAPAAPRVQAPTPPDTRQQTQAAIDRIRQQQEAERLRQQTQDAIDQLARQAAAAATPAPQPPAPTITASQPAVAVAATPVESTAESSWDITGDRDAITYLEAVTAVITEHFKNRIDMSVQITRDPVVRFSLRRDGHIIPESVTIRTSSGSQIIDRALALAVQRGNPYMPFPASIPRQTITIDVRGNIHE